MKDWLDATENMSELYELMTLGFENRVNPHTLVCPNCHQHNIHYFYYGEAGGRGGSWIWCSACRRFIHASSKVPAWWKKIETVPDDVLTPQPEWLDANLSAWESILISQITEKNK